MIECVGCRCFCVNFYGLWFKYNVTHIWTVSIVLGKPNKCGSCDILKISSGKVHLLWQRFKGEFRNVWQGRCFKNRLKMFFIKNGRFFRKLFIKICHFLLFVNFELFCVSLLVLESYGLKFFRWNCQLEKQNHCFECWTSYLKIIEKFQSKC